LRASLREACAAHSFAQSFSGHTCNMRASHGDGLPDSGSRRDSSRYNPLTNRQSPHALRVCCFDSFMLCAAIKEVVRRAVNEKIGVAF
jgi:hypothetical protein